MTDSIGFDINEFDANTCSKVLQDQVVDIVRKAAPEVILTHSPNDYSPDLTAVSRLTVDAALKASIYHYVTNEKPFGKTVPIYFMEPFAGIGFLPEEYVDITNH